MRVANLRAITALACLAAAAAPVLADPIPALGEHPAVLVQRQPQHIDPNTFVVQPPASVTWGRGHANGEHPAVLVARRAATTGIDPNTFLVQPPASVTWTIESVANPLKLAGAL